MEKGYYWIKWNGQKTIGYCNGAESLAWTIVGEEYAFDNDSVEVLKEIKFKEDKE